MDILEERREIMKEKSNNELISSLKGRISKVLSSKSKLEHEEVSGLEGIYNAIDTFIVSEKDAVDTHEFKEDLILFAKFLKGTKRSYIKEHIIPLVNKISIKQWGNLNE